MVAAVESMAYAGYGRWYKSHGNRCMQRVVKTGLDCKSTKWRYARVIEMEALWARSTSRSSDNKVLTQVGKLGQYKTKRHLNSSQYCWQVT